MGVHTTMDNDPYRQDQVQFPFRNEDETEIQMGMRGHCSLFLKLGFLCDIQSTKAQVTSP